MTFDEGVESDPFCSKKFIFWNNESPESFALWQDKLTCERWQNLILPYLVIGQNRILYYIGNVSDLCNIKFGMTYYKNEREKIKWQA